MSNLRLLLSVVLCVLIAAYVIVSYLDAVDERRTMLETYDDAEARQFQKDCDGWVRTHTHALKHTLICWKEKEED